MANMNGDEAQKEAEAMLEQLSKNRGAFQAATPAPQKSAPFPGSFNIAFSGSKNVAQKQLLLYGAFVLTLLFTLGFFWLTSEDDTRYPTPEEVNRAMLR